MAVTPAPQSPEQVDRRFRPARSGVAARTWVAAGLVLMAILLPLAVPDSWHARIALAAIYGMLGLSLNVLLGHAGQVSLGHQAFVGLGAFVSAFVATELGGLGFVVALPVAGLAAAALAGLVGVAALRSGLGGPLLAVATLALGLAAEATLFAWTPLSGGPDGVAAPRPDAFRSDLSFAYLGMALLAAALLVDWRMSRTKAARALGTVRRNPRIAASLGIAVGPYRILAFAASGFLAGVAGALLAHLNGVARPGDFTLILALTWVAMTVVGGLRSRAGVVIGSVFFALFPFLLHPHAVQVPLLGPRDLTVLVPLAGAALLLLTVTTYPAGLGGQLLPLRRWLGGGRLGPESPSAAGGAGPPDPVAGPSDSVAAARETSRAIPGAGPASLPEGGG